jgi:hypothetical protein
MIREFTSAEVREFMEAYKDLLEQIQEYLSAAHGDEPASYRGVVIESPLIFSNPPMFRVIDVDDGESEYNIPISIFDNWARSIIEARKNFQLMENYEKEARRKQYEKLKAEFGQ